MPGEPVKRWGPVVRRPDGDRTDRTVGVRATNQHEIDPAADQAGDQRVEAALAQARANMQRGDAAARTRPEARAETVPVSLSAMEPAQRLAELDRRLVGMQLYEAALNNALEDRQYSGDEIDSVKAAKARLESYIADVPELQTTTKVDAARKVREAMQTWRDQTAAAVKAQADAEAAERNRPHLQQFEQVQPKGYGSDTNWYVLSIEPSGTYIVANKDLVQRGQRSARGIVEEVRLGTKDTLGIVYRRGETVGFEMPWQQLEALCKR